MQNFRFLIATALVSASIISIPTHVLHANPYAVPLEETTAESEEEKKKKKKNPLEEETLSAEDLANIEPKAGPALGLGTLGTVMGGGAAAGGVAAAAAGGGGGGGDDGGASAGSSTTTPPSDGDDGSGDDGSGDDGSGDDGSGDDGSGDDGSGDDGSGDDGSGDDGSGDDGSGDDGSGDDGSGDETDPLPVDQPINNPSERQLSQEEEASTGLTTINAFDAYDRGYTGAGISIGIMDSGILNTHSEFEDRVQDCYNAANALTGCENTDAEFHGTHVTGIAAAARDDVGMHGVAYEADVYSADIFQPDGSSVGFDQQALAMTWLVDSGVSAINNSYGVRGFSYDQFSFAVVDSALGAATNIGQAYRYADTNDVINVWSAGNDGLSQPGVFAALPLYYPELEESWVAVAAVTTNGGALADYSNSCGDAADFCISAPGGQSIGENADGGIFSTFNIDNFYATASGTSMAAPHVTGSIAILLDAFGPGTTSNLSAEQVVDVMFATANKTGIYADSTIYGQGLLDLDAATQPDAPTLAVATSSFDNAQLVSNSSIQFGPAFGDAASLSLDGVMIGANDQYGRIFDINLASMVNPAETSLNSAKLLSRFGKNLTQSVSLGSGTTLNFAFKPDQNIQTKMAGPTNAFDHHLGFSAQDQNQPEQELQRFSFRSEVTKDLAISVHYGLNPGTTIGLQRHEILSDSLLNLNDQSLNPFMDFAGSQETISTGMSAKISEKITLSALSYFNSEQDSDPFLDEETGFDQVMGSVIEASYAASDILNIGMTSGIMREDDNILGLENEGAFETDNNTDTYYTGLNIDYALNDRFSLIGTWQVGWTDAQETADSLFSDFGTIRSQSYTVGLIGHDQFKHDDEMALTIHQPLRVEDAKADLNLPVARADNGDVLYQSETINLSPSGREINIQAHYKMSFDDNQDFSAGVMMRFEPGHVEDASTESIGLIRYSVRW